MKTPKAEKDRRSNRLVIPLRVDERELLDQAADAVGLTTAAFARRYLVRRATAVLEKKAARAPLSADAWKAFCQALETPPPASEALRRAAREFEQEAVRSLAKTPAR